MPAKRPRLDDDTRGVSEVTATALLIGIVILGAVIVVTVGGSLISETNEQTTDQTAEVVVQELDSRLETLAESRDTNRIEFDLGDSDPESVAVVEDGGYVNVTADDTTECTTEIPLSSVRYEGDGTTVAYEGGGVFRSSGDGSTVLTDPDLTYRNGSVDVQLVNISGQIDQSTTVATLNVSKSRNESDRRTRRVLTGECIRPDNVTVTVHSDFYRAWGAHLEGETNESVEYYDSNRTVRLTLTSEDLTQAADERRNSVVNLSNASYMDAVNVTDSSIEISKNASRQYSVSMAPVGGTRPEMGKVERIETTTNISRPPLDVVFVMDESGSMGNTAEAGDSVDKAQAARDAAQNFTTELNLSKDRVGIVGFYDPDPDNAQYYTVDGEYLTGDADAFNSTLGNTEESGGTHANAGLRDANELLQLRSATNRNKVVVLLSDGNNDGQDTTIDGNTYGLDEATKIRANQSDNSDITVYTVNFGGNSDPALLKDVANNSGGEYYLAENASELDEVFTEIAKSIASTKQVAYTPTSTNLTTADGRVFTPQIPGDSDDIATAEQGGHTFKNINDPTAEAAFSHSFALPDGSNLTFNANTYDCNKWVGTGNYETHNGTSYQVSRCANITDPEPIGEENVSVYIDGDDATPLFDGETQGWWQNGINDTLNRSAGPSDDLVNWTSHEFTLESNQALVVYDFPDSANSTNRMLVLYEIGLSEDEARPEGVVRIRVDDVQIGED
jgi:Mg-chelatase subunit ChlD